MQAGEIKVVLTLDNGQFTIATQKAGQTIQELKKTLDQTAASSKSLENHFTGLYTKFHDTVRTASLLRFALQDIHDLFLALPSRIIKTAAEFERMGMLMQGMSDQIGNTAKSLDAVTSRNYIVKMSLETPFDIKALTDAFVKFKSAGLDPTDGSMKGLVESVAKFGGTSDTLHRASIAVQQMAGKGVISMEELRQQLGEAVPNAMATMARSAGVSMQELNNKVKTGTVEANFALKAMFTGMQIENYGASARLMETWDGMLSQLKTKFSLFQLDVANAGFFDSMKKQLQDVIDVFGTAGAKAFADDFGMALKRIVDGIREVIDWINEWKGTIGTVATLMAGLFIGQKVSSMVDNFKKSGVMASFKEGMQDAVDAAAKQADVINLKKLQNEALVKDYQKGYEAELQLARETQAKRLVQYDQEIAAAQAHVQALKAQRQQDLNDSRDYNAKRMALTAEAQSLDMRLDANRFRAKLLMEEAQAARVASEAANTHSVALAREINATIDSVVALERKKAALAASTVTGNENTRILQQAIANTKDHVTQLTAQAKAVSEVSFGMQALHGAMNAGKMIWDAFGGWVGIAIGVLVTLGEKLWEYMNRWSEFRDIVEQTKRGVSSEDKRDKAEARLKELDKEIENRRRELKNMKGDSETLYSPEGVPVVTVTRTELQAQLDAALAERRTASDTYNEQVRLLAENAAQLRQMQAKRILDREIAAVFNAWEGAIKDVEKRKLAALEKAQEGGKELTQKERKEIERPFNLEAVNAQKSAAKSALVLVDSLIADTEKQLQSAKITEDKRKELTARLKMLNDDQLGMRKELQKLAEDAEQYLGKGLKITKKDEPDKPEDPLVRYAAMVESNLAQVRARLKSNIDDVRNMASLRNEAVLQIMGKMASGSFDKPLGKDANDVERRQYAGDQEARKSAISDFVKAMAEGQPDVDAFIDSLKGLDDNQRKLIKNTIENLALISLETERRNALKDAQIQVARATEEANAALIKLESGGAAKVSAGMLQMEKHFAALEEKYKALGGTFAAFNKEKAEAFSAQGKTDARTLAEDFEKQARDQNLANIKATQSAGEAREAQHRENLRRIQEREDFEIASMKRIRDMEGQTDSTRAQLNEEMGRVFAASLVARKAENERFFIESNQGMIALRKQWGDSITAMQGLSVSWANQFMDYLAKVTTGGSGMWKDMVRGMAMDLYKVTLKQSLGGLVTSAFGSIGSTLAGAFGMTTGEGGAGKRTGSSPMDALYVQDASMGLGSKDSPLKDVKNELSDTWTTMKDKADEMFSGMKDSMSGLLKGLGDSLSGMWDGLSGLFSGGGGGSGGGFMDFIGSFFADGGVMTSRGSMSLNKYASGGVANSPQLAMFGEGATPEAYVPLPDGRSIPVKMQGNTTTNNQGGVYISITVNKDGSDNSKSGGDDAKAWSNMANRVRGVVMEELVVQQRPGGVLYR